MLRRVVAVLILVAGCSRASEPEVTPAPSAAVVVTPSAAPSASTAAATPPASVSVSAPAPPTASQPPPAADVRAIGMHIGGGPNDDANKGPLLESIAKHNDALGRCWEALPKREKVDFGIDADIPAKGGRAKVGRPRSTVADAAFVTCAMGVFSEIEFVAPKSRLDTTVSVSVRISPR